MTQYENDNGEKVLARDLGYAVQVHEVKNGNVQKGTSMLRDDYLKFLSRLLKSGYRRVASEAK